MLNLPYCPFDQIHILSPGGITLNKLDYATMKGIWR